MRLPKLFCIAKHHGRFKTLLSIQNGDDAREFCKRLIMVNVILRQPLVHNVTKPRTPTATTTMTATTTIKTTPLRIWAEIINTDDCGHAPNDQANNPNP